MSSARSSTSRRRPARKFRPNSQSVEQLQRDVDALERQCDRAGIAVIDAVLIGGGGAAAVHDATPMLGHTKGNTKSNRKKTKAMHLTVLSQTRDRLERLLLARRVQPCTLPVDTPINNNDHDEEGEEEEEEEEDDEVDD